MPGRWAQTDGPLEVSLAREDRANRPTMIEIRDRDEDAAVVVQPHDVRWLVAVLGDALAASEEHHGST
jgi:hypothetical protein